jgi:hypothetical protein
MKKYTVCWENKFEYFIMYKKSSISENFHNNHFSKSLYFVNIFPLHFNEAFDKIGYIENNSEDNFHSQAKYRVFTRSSSFSLEILSFTDLSSSKIVN